MAGAGINQPSARQCGRFTVADQILPVHVGTLSQATIFTLDRCLPNSFNRRRTGRKRTMHANNAQIAQLI
jgi:hypothetical protein